MKPIPQLVLLQELFRQVLQVSLGKVYSVSYDDDLLSTSVTGNLYGSAKLTSLSVHLEAVMEKVLKGRGVKDGIRDGTATVDNKLAGLVGDGCLRVSVGRRRYLGGSHSGRKKFVT